jgi:hypothetical protein
VKSDKSDEQLGNHLIGTVASINISAGGVPKRRVNDAKVSRSGLEKDAQNDKNTTADPKGQFACIRSNGSIHFRRKATLSMREPPART